MAGWFDLPLACRASWFTLDWPTDWLACVQHFAAWSRADLRQQFKALCDARPCRAKIRSPRHRPSRRLQPQHEMGQSTRGLDDARGVPPPGWPWARGCLPTSPTQAARRKRGRARGTGSLPRPAGVSCWADPPATKATIRLARPPSASKPVGTCWTRWQLATPAWIRNLNSPCASRGAGGRCQWRCARCRAVQGAGRRAWQRGDMACRPCRSAGRLITSA